MKRFTNNNNQLKLQAHKIPNFKHECKKPRSIITLFPFAGSFPNSSSFENFILNSKQMLNK